MSNLVIVETKKQAQFVVEKMNQNEFDIANTTILACDYNAALFLESANQKFCLLEDYKVPFDIQEIQDVSFEMSEKWNEKIPSLTNRLFYKGHPVSAPICRQLTYYLFAQLYNFLLIDSILKIECPDKIWVFEVEDWPLNNYDDFRGTNEECVFAQFFSHFAYLKQIALKTIRLNYASREQCRKVSMKQASKRVFELMWRNIFLLRRRHGGLHQILLSLTPDFSLILGKALRKQNNCEIFFLTETLPMKTLCEFMHNKIKIILRKYKFKRSSKNKWFDIWNDPEVVGGLAEFFQYKGYDIWKFVRKRFEFLFKVYFHELAGFYDFYEQILQRNRITVVVVNEDVSEHNRALVLSAKKLGIKSLVLQHGVIGKKPGFYPVVADKFACWGPYHQKRLLNMGIFSEKIVLTGCPKVEDWEKTIDTQKSRHAFFKEFKISPNKKIILYTNTIFREEWKVDEINLRFTPQQIKQHLEALVRETRKLDGCQLVIKLHPRDKHYEFTKTILEKLEAANEVLLLKCFDTHELLSIADVIVDPAWSSINLEALVMGKPLLRLNLDHREDIFDFNERGVSVGCNDMNRFSEALEEVQKLKIRPRFMEDIKSVLYDHLLVEDQMTPAARLSSLIFQLSSESRRPNRVSDLLMDEEKMLINK